jgi:hypothetical protein
MAHLRQSGEIGMSSEHEKRQLRELANGYCAEFESANDRPPTSVEMANALSITTQTARIHLKRLKLFSPPRFHGEDVYQVYVDHWQQYENSPTYKEVADELGISASAVYHHVCRLVERGKLEFNPLQSWRGVRLKGLNDASQSHSTI